MYQNPHAVPHLRWHRLCLQVCILDVTIIVTIFMFKFSLILKYSLIATQTFSTSYMCIRRNILGPVCSPLLLAILGVSEKIPLSLGWSGSWGT